MKLLAAIVALLVSGCAAATHAPPTQENVAGGAAPFARVALALKGCSSCSHCRSTIRQTAQAKAAGAGVRIQGEGVEVVFAKPQRIALSEVVRGLSGSRLHEIEVLDVLLDAEGFARKTASGDLEFALAETGQSFPLRVPEFAEAPPFGEKIRLRAVVRDWKREESLFLELKYRLDAPLEIAAEDD